MPDLMAKYCKSLHITDMGLSCFFNMIDSVPALKESTIVITGDHSVFWKERRDEFIEYCAKKNLNWGIEFDACPVIYYSSKIKNDIVVTGLCYQVDIFPTLLHLTGNEKYYWQGFGVNVLDSTSNRIDNKIIFDLSDKIIRADFFYKLECK
jgi:phosphoglycerol transferase MdoB-like AlkP superfamily enzyme